MDDFGPATSSTPRLVTQDITAAVLAVFLESLRAMLKPYSQFLIAVSRHGRDCDDDWQEVDVDHELDELTRKMTTLPRFHPDDSERIMEFLARVRIELHVGMAESGKLRAPSASELTLRAAIYVRQVWEQCRKTAEKSRTDWEYLYSTHAAYIFDQINDGGIPRPNDLTVLLDHEESLARVWFARETDKDSATTIVANGTNIAINSPNAQFATVRADVAESGEDSGGTTDQQSSTRRKKRSDRAINIERLKDEMIKHLLAARDHAWDTKDRTGTAELLPRPTQKELGELSGLSETGVSRCLNDPRARELKTYWDTADDLNLIMKFKPISRGRQND